MTEETTAPPAETAKRHSLTLQVIVVLVFVAVFVFAFNYNQNNGITTNDQAKSHMNSCLMEYGSTDQDELDALECLQDDGTPWWSETPWLSGLMAAAVTYALGRAYLSMVKP